MGCSTSFAKMLLFIFNVAFFIFGVISLSVGIWIVASRAQMFEFLNLIDAKVSDSANSSDISNIENQHGMVEIAGRVLIAVGVFTIVIGFCGCCGAMKESKVLLIIYIALVTLILILQLTSAIMAAVFEKRVSNEAAGALLNLQNKYFIALPQYNYDNSTAKGSVTHLINYMQVAFECCGAVSAGDVSDSSSWLNSDRTLNGRELQRPLTCCAMNDKNSMLAATYNWKALNVSSLKDPECPFANNSTELHSQTCVTGIKNFVSHYATPLIIISVSIGLIELVGIILGCCLVRAIDNDNNYAKGIN